MKQQSGQNWTSRQFQGAWLGLAIAEAITLSQTEPQASALQPRRWSMPTPSFTQRQRLASDCSVHLPLTAQAVQLSQHLLNGLHPRQPGLSWLDIQDKYLQFTTTDADLSPDQTAQAVVLLPLWLLISDRPNAIAYIAQQVQTSAPNPKAALSLAITALTLRHLLADPLNPSGWGYGKSADTARLLDRLRADLVSDWLPIAQPQPADELLYTAVTQAPTLMVARHLINQLPVELRAIAVALYALTHLADDFAQAIRCAQSLQPDAQYSQSAIALTGAVLGLAAPLSLPADWRTVVMNLMFPPLSQSLVGISQALWRAWAGVYVP